jgi:spermidine/putrescine transport system ATP-binding protein
MIAGLERPDAGRILLDGEDISTLPPNRRKVNTVFQNYALFPHLDVFENIAFGLRVAKRPQREIDNEVEAMLEMIRMKEERHRKPDQLSGGQKQRVAVARALVNKPQVLLLDEPLAALDLKLRQHMLMELDLIHDRVGITFIYVTHDQNEAMSLSDRIAVMQDGRISQLGSPVEIYEAPRSGFVASFIGDANFLEGRVLAEAGPEHCRLGVPGLPDVVCYNDKRIAPGEAVSLVVRPEKMRISRERPEEAPLVNVVPGTVEDVIYLGSHTRYRVRVGERRFAVEQQHGRFFLDEKPIRWEEPVWLAWHADDGTMLELADVPEARGQ